MKDAVAGTNAVKLTEKSNETSNRTLTILLFFIFYIRIESAALLSISY